nr:alpha-2-macroglobulin family protein [Beijerinckia indica]
MRVFVAGLLVTLVSLLPAIADAKREAVLTQDVDYFGFDLRTEQNVTLDQCQASCLGNKACKAFTYNPKVKWCFLKSDFDRMNQAPGAIAGKIIDSESREADLGAAPKLDFISNELIRQARDFKANLPRGRAPLGGGAPALIQQARKDLTNGKSDAALESLRLALATAPDKPELWSEVARAGNELGKTTSLASQMALVALNGYAVTRTASMRASALVELAVALEKSENYRAALNAYKASLALVNAKSVEAAYLDLKARRGFRIIDHSIDKDTISPRACVQFSEALVKAGVDYAPFLTLDGKAPKAFEAKDHEICVEGLAHGQHYKLGLRSGLPSSVGEVLEAPVSLDIYVRDRSPLVRFTGDNFVLPGSARRGIPIVSVNTDRADLKLYRIGDRGLAGLLTNTQFLTQLDRYSAQRIQDESGELVWQGAIDIQQDLNKEVVTSFPVDEALPKRQPGVYVLTAASPHTAKEDSDTQATQWFVVSDLGITTYAGTDALSIFVRSLASAKPMADVDLQLLAKNNEILGTAKTDAEGRATFSAGLMRGTGGLAPTIIMARAGGSDFVFLDMTRAGFDLSDRGVAGRESPGAIDLLAWTERGIYRVGETVHATALARDDRSVAIANLPLTFVFTRPDGVEDRRFVRDGGTAGGYTLDLPLPDNALRGTWTMKVFVDPKRSAIGERTFLVDDFIPDRTEFSLTSKVKEIEPSASVPVSVEGRFLYGAPAAGLSLEGDVNVKPTRENALFKDYVFGLADEEMGDGKELALEDLPVLDEAGKATFNVTLGDLPSTTQWLSARIVVRMREGNGRAIERALDLPVKAKGPMIGIKPEFSGDLGENTIANFHVIGVSPDGHKRAMHGLTWKLVSVERRYQWYREGSAWKYEPVNATKQVAAGMLDIGADGARISVPVVFGRYRLEIETSEAEGPSSSVAFDAGWFVEASSTETPDGLEIALDKQSYKVGETATLKILSRYAGEALVAVGAEKLIAVKTASLGDKGGEIALPVTADWGAGTYITATLFRPGDARDNRMPMRAIGIKWLRVDPGDRQLLVKLDLPAKMQPRQPLAIDLEVAGAGVREDAYVTVAAVDVGILNLTRYEPPNPDGWYFGQRRLGLEIRDLYGRLIDGSLGVTGRLRTGGDGGQMALQGSPPTQKLVAFFSGPVKLDAGGKAHVVFDIPQFNGTARVMAVAWSKSGVGHAVGDVIIRDPVVVTASLPRFLAPEDKAELRLDIANTDAPPGDYHIKAEGNAAIGFETSPFSRTIHLAAGEKSSLVIPIHAFQPGNGEVSVTVSNGVNDAPQLSLAQTLDVPVRPAILPMTARHVISLIPKSSLTIDRQLLADFQLQGASVSINVSRAAAFDVPALLMALDRYPYGCAEQITSRALPLLYLSELAKQYGLAEEGDVHQRVQEGIYKVLSYQGSSGGFGLWAAGSGDLWLDSYISDFLTRAREQKFDVPEEALAQALENLQNSLAYDDNLKDKGNEIAYALYVLARNRRAVLSDLRYYADTKLADFSTPLAKAHLAAALAFYGDAERSKATFLDALGLSQQMLVSKVSLARADYGSQLRDAAAVLALASESRPVPPIVPALVKIVSQEWEQKPAASTQELTWMLLAARGLQGADKDLALTVNGVPREGGYRAHLDGDALLDHPVKLTNETAVPVTATVTTVAAPVRPLPAGGNGFLIDRKYYTLGGKETSVTRVKQNERYVVVLHVSETNQWPQRILINDLLPAGFEIDNPSLVDSAQLSNFDWLDEVDAAHTEFRNDRFIAAFDHLGNDHDDITLAYIVRAVTPGIYDHPAATVEDMYRPQFSAQTSTGRMEVVAGQK